MSSPGDFNAQTSEMTTQFQFTVPAADLIAGANAATFNMNTKGTAGAGVYYDIIKLESD